MFTHKPSTDTREFLACQPLDADADFISLTGACSALIRTRFWSF
jgi:hypothetical protein